MLTRATRPHSCILTGHRGQVRTDRPTRQQEACLWVLCELGGKQIKNVLVAAACSAWASVCATAEHRPGVLLQIPTPACGPPVQRERALPSQHGAVAPRARSGAASENLLSPWRISGEVAGSALCVLAVCTAPVSLLPMGVSLTVDAPPRHANPKIPRPALQCRSSEFVWG